MRLSAGAGQRLGVGICLVGLLAGQLAGTRAAAQGDTFPIPRITHNPRSYVCPHTSVPPTIDGALDDPVWQATTWTAPFGDIEGPEKPEPRYKTVAAMAWDDSCFYAAANLEEPNLWATYSKRDMVIYHENDFELFIDPDGDTHDYYELEMNALNTVWDLLLLSPYRDGGPAVNGLDIAGLRTAVQLTGTLNDPSDTDTGWTLEIAIPWKSLAECAGVETPPREGDIWRMNYSRVEWQLVSVDSLYLKKSDPATGDLLPEDNWTWSPQGLVAMHYPEMWGYVQFSDAAAGRTPSFTPDPNEPLRWALRKVYYSERTHAARMGGFATLKGLDDSGASILLPRLEKGWHLAIVPTPGGFVASLGDGDSVYRIREDGQLRQLK